MEYHHTNEIYQYISEKNHNKLSLHLKRHRIHGEMKLYTLKQHILSSKYK